MSNASNLSTLANVLDDGNSGEFLKSTGSGGVAFDTVAAGAVVYATADLLPLSGFAAGDMAYVTATNRFYINNGSGWYSISLVNTNPNITSVADASSGTTPFTLATDQTATVITITAADPEEVPLTYGYSVTSGSLNGSTVAQGTGSNSNVFTVTPHASNDATFTITFTASDGINQATSANAFSLSFVTIVADSNHTTLLATATSTGGNSTIEDSSSANSGSGHNISVNGDTYAGSFSPYRSGGYSVHLDDGEEISFPDSANYNISNGSFSIEAWVNPTSYDSPWSGVISQFSSSSRGWGLAFSSTQITFLGSTNGGSSTNVIGSVTSSVPLNQWTHLLVTRDSNTIRIFKNGVLINSFTESGTFNNTTNPLRIGELNSAAAENFRGYIRDVRFVKGSIPTEYQTSSTTNGTTIFTAPSEPLIADTNTVLLTCHLPDISDGSANDATPTLSGSVSTKPFSPYDYSGYDAADHGGSVYFDGAGDRIEMAGHSSLVLDTSDFTLEFWYKHVANVTAMRFFGNNYQNSTWGGGRWTMGILSGKLIFQVNSLHGTGKTTSTVNIDDGFWHHCSLTRNGSTFTLRVDGGDAVTYNNSGSVDGGNSYGFTIGSRGSSNESINGYISDFRIVKGTVVYSGNFTPPTGPLTTTGGTYPSTTNVNTSITASNTSLLIKGTDASIIDKSQGANLKLIGTTTGSTTQVKFANTKSMYFDGNSDYITIADDEAYGFGTGDWTIETWLYCTKTGGFNAIFDTRQGTGTEAGSFGLGMHTTGRVQMYSNATSPAQFLYPTDTLSFNTWQHLAIVKNSGTTTMYFNGTAASTTYSDSRDYGSSQPVQIGKDDTTSNYFGGYMQDFRITKGLARYTATDETSNIPTAPLEG